MVARVRDMDFGLLVEVVVILTARFSDARDGEHKKLLSVLRCQVSGILRLAAPAS
jgi:hypothetical protein